MPFEDTLKREQQRQAANAHDYKRKLVMEAKIKEDERLKEKQRLEELRLSSEWLEVLQLSENEEFLKALTMYWDKFGYKDITLKPRVYYVEENSSIDYSSLVSDQHGKPTENLLTIKYHSGANINVLYGYVSFFITTGQHMRPQHYDDNSPVSYDYDVDRFDIFYSQEEIPEIPTTSRRYGPGGSETFYGGTPSVPSGLTIMHHGNQMVEFVGSLDDFLGHMAQKIVLG